MIEAQKEAQRLYGKFYFELCQIDGDHTEECTISLLAIRCAVACCDEIIKTHKVYNESLPPFGIGKDFYENIKHELHKL